MAIFLGSTTFFAQFMFTVSHNGNPIIYRNYNYRDENYTQKT